MPDLDYLVESPLRHNGNRFEIGTVIPLSEMDAAPLLRDKIIIPRLVDSPLAAGSSPATGDTILPVQGQEEGNPALQLTNINTATAEVLETLPHIGKATAQKIIQGRPYAFLEELQNRVKLGLPAQKLDELAPLLEV